MTARLGPLQFPSWLTRERGVALRAALLLLALAAAIRAQNFLEDRAHTEVAVGLYVGAIALVAVAVSGWRVSTTRLPGPAWLEWAAVALIVGLALALRIYRIDAMPPGLHPDESVYGLEAADIAQWKAHPLWSDRIFGGRIEGQAYVAAGFFKVFGIEPFSLRLASAVAGTGTVLFLYLFAREAFGSRVALLAGFLLAVNRWHINYSRIGWEIIFAPLAAVAAAYFLVRGWRTGNPWWYAVSGAALSLGMYSYVSFRLVPPVFAIVIVLALLHGRLSYLRRHWVGLVAFAAAAVLVIAPLGKWAWQNQDRFNARFREVSVFKVDEPMESLGENIGRELAMFNYRGPPFGLQNLPEEPMLAAPLGILFVLGLGVLASRAARPEYAFVALLLAAGITAAVFAVPEETPHAHRAIVAAPMVVLAAAFFLAEAGGAIESLLPGRTKVAVWALIFALVAFIAGLEADTYFNKMAHDPRVRNSFSSNEADVARYLEKVADDNTVYMAAPFYHFPGDTAIEFRAWEVRGKHTSLDYVEHVPARRASRDVVYILHDQQRVLLPFLTQVYPGGAFEEHRDPFGGLIFMTYRVGRDEVEAVRGLEARYYANSEWAGAPAAARREPAIDLAASPPPLAPPYSVEWTGSIFIPRAASYRIWVDGAGEGSVTVDGAPVTEERLPLEKGLHSLRVRYRARDAEGASLAWDISGVEREVPPEVLFPFDLGLNGLRASYWENDKFEGEPAVVEIDRAVFANNVIFGPYSIEWSGWLRVDQPGEYRLATFSDDGSFIYVDGELVVDNGGQHGGTHVDAPVRLERGYHPIRVLYFETFGGFVMDLRWTPPGGQEGPIPMEALFYRLPPGAAAATAPPPQETPP